MTPPAQQADASVEDRLRHLETILDRLVAVAREHPFGRALLRKLGIE
jgi:hypothetical protein